MNGHRTYTGKETNRAVDYWMPKPARTESQRSIKDGPIMPLPSPRWRLWK